MVPCPHELCQRFRAETSYVSHVNVWQASDVNSGKGDGRWKQDIIIVMVSFYINIDIILFFRNCGLYMRINYSQATFLVTRNRGIWFAPRPSTTMYA